MIVPSIDLMNGHAVQLVGGRELKLDAGDPRPIAERFAVAGEIAVVDLDAALGRGSNAGVIGDLLGIAPCRVGGGIRTVEDAVRWLDAGAVKVVLGTSATPDVLSGLPRERVVAALDAVEGEVVIDGWRTRTGQSVMRRMQELSGLAGGFLVTFIEREGRMGGTKLEAVEELVRTAGDARLTIAGGITSTAEIAALDRLGADAQVGMALYKGRITLADAIAAPLVSDRPDGLWPTVVADEHGVALGLTYSSGESLRRAVESRRGVYHSRSRGVWIKGESSGATQELLRVNVDCDRDALRFTVRQGEPGFCHRGTRTCWGPDRGLAALARRLLSRWSPTRRADAPPESYTRRLLDDPALLRAKLIEEAGELADARDRDHVAAEAADLLYFALVAATRGGATLENVEAVLDRRALRVTRRPGDAKRDGEGRR
jgi:phosphoribosyl-ATP pyrophosphohydrolase